MCVENCRRRLRFPDFNYSKPGAYFLTICARRNQCLFGEIVEDRMRRNKIGGIVMSCWNEIPSHFPYVALDAFVVMPNHIHGILLFTDVVAGHARPLPVVIGSFKSAVSKRIGTSIWQRSYWDRIIRNEEERNLTRHYVEDNPLRWPTDKEYIA